MHTLTSLLLPAPPTQCSSSTSSPQCSDSRQTNRDLLPQIHGKESKDTIPTVCSIKTHHTHKTTKISLLRTVISFLRPTENPNIYIYIYILTQLYNQRKIKKRKRKKRMISPYPLTSLNIPPSSLQNFFDLLWTELKKEGDYVQQSSK